MNLNINLTKTFLIYLFITVFLIPHIFLVLPIKIIRDHEFNYSIKTSADNSSWTRTWDGYGLDTGTAIATDSLDNIYVAGTTVDKKTGFSYIVLLKFNTSGNLLWTRTWRDNRTTNCLCKAIAIDNSNNIYLAGTAEGSLFDDMLLLKYDSFGNKIWNCTWGGEGWDNCNDITIDSQNNLYLVGESYISELKSMDICIVKLNSSGSYLWNLTLGSELPDRGNAISIDKNDEIYIGGENNYQSIIFKLNSSGLIQWNYTWSYVYSTVIYDLTIDYSNYILAVDSVNLFKFNGLGEQLWNITLNKPSQIYPCLITDSLNNIYVIQNGKTKCVSNTFFLISNCICTNIYLTKYNSTGNIIWDKRCTGCSDDRCNDIALDSLGNIYLCGTLVSKRGCENIIWDIIIIKNPKQYNGICFIFYYDLFFAIIIPLIVILLIIIIYTRKKRKKLTH